MEWNLTNIKHKFVQRKYSNETMRSLRNYINHKNLKLPTEGYNEVLDRIELLLADKRVRTKEEKIADEQEYLKGII